jgi:methylmalonyl-CoA mutase N-terminal domain/subunit
MGSDEDRRAAIRARNEAWQRQYATRLAPGEAGGATTSGFEVLPVYTPLDVDGGQVLQRDLERLGMPGEAPYARGVRPGMYREQLWVMGMYSGRASPEETNRRIRSLLQSGQKGFSVALDLPTQNGYDSDHPLARGEVGKVGVPIDSLHDMRTLLSGIALNEVRQIRTTANAIGPIAVALFIAAAQTHGYSPKDFKVMFQNDVLKEYVARGTYIFPPRRGLRFSVDVIEYCAEHLPHWEPIEFCGYHIRDSGSSAVQELAIALADGRAYMDAALARGLRIDDFARSIFLFLAAGIDVFEEVAKYRAARRIWSDLLRNHYGATDEASCALKIFVYTLGSALTARDPLNNTVRVAYEAMAAVLGGVQTMATSSFDEALGLPSDDAVRVALRTQQILAYETGVARTADPLGGSYYVECLTDQMEAAVREYMRRIDEQGGALAAIESGWIKAQLDEAAYRLQRRIDSGEHPMVGVNRFVDDQPVSLRPVPTVSGEEEARQIESLRRVRATRDAARAQRALDAVRIAAQEGRNTVPPILDAVKAYATVGEICDVLRQVWGRHTAA